MDLYRLRTKIIASGPITSWQIDEDKVETVADFVFQGSKITADGDCSHEIKRCLLHGRKDMTNPDSILKSRNITLPTNIHLVKAMVFPVVMYGCEIWTIRKAEHQRIDAFELWCWRRLLRVPWTVRRSNQSILNEISPECLLKGLMLKLKLQSFGHLMQRTDSWENPDTGKDWRWEEKGKTEDKMVGWHPWLNGHEFGWTTGVGDGQGGLVCCSPWGHKESDRPRDRTELNCTLSFHVTLSIHLTLSSPIPMSISLFSISVFLLLPYNYCFSIIFLDSIYMCCCC